MKHEVQCADHYPYGSEQHISGKDCHCRPVRTGWTEKQDGKRVIFYFYMHRRWYPSTDVKPDSGVCLTGFCDGMGKTLQQQMCKWRTTGLGAQRRYGKRSLDQAMAEEDIAT